VLRSASRMIEDRFGITHSTLQVEPSDFNIVQDFGGRSRQRSNRTP